MQAQILLNRSSTGEAVLGNRRAASVDPVGYVQHITNSNDSANKYGIMSLTTAPLPQSDTGGTSSHALWAPAQRLIHYRAVPLLLRLLYHTDPREFELVRYVLNALEFLCYEPAGISDIVESYVPIGTADEQGINSAADSVGEQGSGREVKKGIAILLEFASGQVHK
jgi:hypothetical protein